MLNLNEVLRVYDHKAILEASILGQDKQARRLKPDPEKKLKLSLLDMISELQPEADSCYEVFETAPAGDLSKVRILIHAKDAPSERELRMLVGRRTLDNYFLEDPLFDSINQSGEPG